VALKTNRLEDLVQDERQVGGERDAGEVAIRAMTPDDYASVTRVWTAAGLSFRPRGRDRPAKVRAELESGRGVFLVAEADGEVVGVVLGTHDGRKAWINRLAVEPAYQRRGIATRLVRVLEERLESMGLEIVAALVESHNRASLEFFKAIGYDVDAGITYVSKRRSADA
jgi:ribosomal protein S18 acetylase RimI-like enzyme